jgi:D-alanyl-D-alanine carboxypeptidase (penicillin-binding protein 5/6)
MYRKPQFFLVLIVIILNLLFPAGVSASPDISCEAAVLMDIDNGQILYQKNIDQRVYPASTTKILTALVAIKKGNFEDMVNVSRDACLVGGSHIGLQEDEIVNFNDLLYIMMLSSANDAAVAVAEHIGGSVEGFAGAMNEEARALGAVSSNFTNPHGLHDPDHYTTAGDMALIAREAMGNSVFKKIAGTYHYKVKRVLPRPVNGIPQEDFVNHNKLLWRSSRYEYPDATGVKTGYTDEARNCLVASAERNGRRLLAVVMKAESFSMYTDAAALLDYGFNDFNRVELVKAGAEISRAAVKKGVTGEVGVVAGRSLYYNLPGEGIDNVDKRIYIDGYIAAPLEKGQKVGTMYFSWEGKGIGSIDLVAGQDVEKNPFFRWWHGSFILIFMYLLLKVNARSRRRRYLARRRKYYP